MDSHGICDLVKLKKSQLLAIGWYVVDYVHDLSNVWGIQGEESFQVIQNIYWADIRENAEEKPYQQNQHKWEDSLLRNVVFLNILKKKVKVSYRKGVYREEF